MKNSIYRRIFASILAVSMLLPMAANAITTADEDTQTKKAATNESVSVQLPEKVSVAELTQGTKILKHIDEAVLETGSHILRLPAEETLNSYAFLNQDGSMTVYYMDKAVKFVDQSGEIVEKNLSLTKTLGGFTTASSDIGLVLPDDPANGINMSYEGHNITLAPMGGTLRNAAQNDGESVIYPNYYGGGMSLKYTPSLDGLKEDIVLSRYSGVNSFTFRLFTDGLRMYQENGRYYLAKSSNSEVQISLGDVVAFDAKGKFSIGTMTVETVTMGQEYLLTLSVDTAFLTSLTTSYPVCIDPTLQVSDNTHGAGAIEDLTVYSGVPNLNADWPYLHCGYYDSTYRVARTLFRLTGLLSDSTYQSLPAADIESVKFYIKEATGSAGIPVYLHANTGNANWTESGSNWNNAGYVVGTRYATASPGLEQFACYDITDLAKAWKNGTEVAQAGFVLVSSNEVSVDKAFYGSETATTSRRPYVVVDYNVGTNFENAIRINSGQTIPVAITASGEQKYFKFQPFFTGMHSIYSEDSSGDPQMQLYNENKQPLEDNDDWVSSLYDFGLTYHFVQTAPYYIVVGGYNGGTCSFKLTVSSTARTGYFTPDNITAHQNNTVSITKAYAVNCYRLQVPIDGTYTIQSITATGDAMLWMYNSNLEYFGSDNNSGGNEKFRLIVYLSADTPYYLVVGHTGSKTGTVDFNVVMPVDIPDGVNHLRNIGTSLYMDVHLDGSQTLPAHQWSLHKDDQERWRFYQQADGTYNIQSQYGNHYYLGISNGNVYSNNVVLLPEATNYAKWNIYAVSTDGSLLIEPVMAPGKVLCVPNSYEGTELQLCWMRDTVQYKKLWRIESHGHATLEAQQDATWCWVAAARMFASCYDDFVDERTQEDATKAINDYDLGGIMEDAAKAATYFLGGYVEHPSALVDYEDGKILSQEAVKEFLDCGDPIYIARRKYKVNTRILLGGHASVIVGYTTVVTDGELEYQFIIYDPWPENAPQIEYETEIGWPENYIPTSGQVLTVTYDVLCYELDPVMENNGKRYETKWEGFMIRCYEDVCDNSHIDGVVDIVTG